VIGAEEGVEFALIAKEQCVVAVCCSMLQCVAVCALIAKEPCKTKALIAKEPCKTKALLIKKSTAYNQTHLAEESRCVVGAEEGVECALV